jgi:hypothetical protein
LLVAGGVALRPAVGSGGGPPGSSVGGRGLASLQGLGPGLKIRGVCWEGGRSLEPSQLDPLTDLGADWISQTPFGWCRSLVDPDVILASDQRMLWGESDSGLVQTATWARARGIHTLLKPHLWVHHGDWVGHIAMPKDEDWAPWFAAYERFILHYAALAEANHMEALAIGTELGGTTRRTDDWRRLIAHVRSVYHGPITYCANWSDEVERIEFWDALDFIGVQAYYPLAHCANPGADSIRAAWMPVVARLEKLSHCTHKPIVFTEVGYKSVAGSLREPWAWDEDGEQDLEIQRQAYEALFGAVWDRPWFGGTFIWKWHPRLAEGYGRAGNDFTPQGKPALDVLRRQYRQAAADQPARTTGRP